MARQTVNPATSGRSALRCGLAPQRSSRGRRGGVADGRISRTPACLEAAHHVAFSAPDISELATPSQPYGGSIPLTKALSEEVLLAWGMNCQPLPRIHGGPVRLIVPGYIGARSIKWITALTVQDHPSDNYFQASAYRIVPADTAQPGDGISLSSIALNCAVLSPDDGATTPAGPLTLRSYALAGDDRTIERVEVSLDRGHSWIPADLEPQLSTWTWRLWSLSCCVTPGPLHVTVHAWDSTEVCDGACHFSG